jgi:general secretion pathway protein L
MSTLIVQLPARARLAARHAPTAPTPEGQALEFALCADDLRVLQHGQALVADLPAARSVVLVLAASDVAWHRLAALPRAPAAKLRPALGSLLEEQLLEEDADLHLALPPQWRAGEPTWVAVTHAAWLRSWIEALETGERVVERIAPACAPLAEDAPGGAPGDAPGEYRAHVTLEEDQAWLSWCDAQGPLHLPLASASVRQLLASVPEQARLRWSASPEAASLAAEVAGMPVAAVSASQRLLEAAAGEWNLRQFNLSSRRRSDRLMRAGLQQLLFAPAWRGLRWGVLALVFINVIGAGLWAWQQNRALAERKRAMTALLQTSFPKVRAIINAPVQMAKELDTLRANAGRSGEADLETLLHAADLAWPPGREPAQSLQFEPGKLSLNAPGWAPAELQALRAKLWPLGLDAQATPEGLSLAPLRGAPPVLPKPDAAASANANAKPAPGASPGAGMQPPPGGGPKPFVKSFAKPALTPPPPNLPKDDE